MKRLIFIILLCLCFAQAQAKTVTVVVGGVTAAGGGTVEVGYTSVGASTDTPDGAVLICSAPFAAPQTGTIDKIYLYSANSTSTQDIKVGVYNGTPTTPTTPVAAGTEFANVGTWSAGWHELSPVSYSVTASNNYCICINTSAGASTTYNYDASGTASYITLTYTNAFPNNPSMITFTSTYSWKANLTY